MHIRKWVIFILAFCILFGPGSWDPATAAEGEGKTVAGDTVSGQKAGATNVDPSGGSLPAAVVPEKEFRFEPVLDGTAVHHDFIIQNKGNTTLNISKVKTG